MGEFAITFPSLFSVLSNKSENAGVEKTILCSSLMSWVVH